jgi:hypothetical protein
MELTPEQTKELLTILRRVYSQEIDESSLANKPSDEDFKDWLFDDEEGLLRLLGIDRIE